MEQPVRKLGPYTLVRKIGRGGFGVVWLGEKRTAIATTQVALKLPRGEDIDLDAFKQEAAIWIQASGHPNVLPLIDADIYDEQVVIVSEYIPDGSLAGWIAEHRGQVPPIESVCEIIDGVLAGLAHLHSRRIIHRDLKPENILLQRETPRLADFGIARLLKSSSHSSQISGTLAYMAPEAFDGHRNEQTDVWSIGIIFYEMLASRLPYDQPDIPSFIGAIMRHDPPPLPSNVPDVLRDIVTKALQRDPTQRYASAAEMRKDLREAEHRVWLGGRETLVNPAAPTAPVPAQTPRPNPLPSPLPPQPTSPSIPPSKTLPFVPAETVSVEPANYSSDSKIKKAHPLFWPIAAAAVLLLFFGVPVIIMLGMGIYSTLNKGKIIDTPVSKPQPVKQSRGPYTLKQTLTGHTKMVRSVVFSPDGQTLASASEDSSNKFWSVQTGALKQTWTGNQASAYLIDFSPDGKRLAGGYGDKSVRIYDVATKTESKFMGHNGGIWGVAFSPDGEHVASASEDNSIRVWNRMGSSVPLSGHSNWVRSVAFSPDGQTLASGSDDRSIKLWDLKTYTLKQTLTGHNNFVMTVAFSPDGRTLASGSEDNTIKLWDAQTGVLKQTLSGHTNWVWCVKFSGDGTMLASSGQDGTIRLWNAQTGALMQSLDSNIVGQTFSVAFSSDGRTIASGGSDSNVKIWQAP